MPSPPLFTVFTATYNRAHTLQRVFNSLRAQTLRNFEWLLIDDGSTDDTEALARDWAEHADFPLRYLRQEHAGKHFAYNRALGAARGKFLSELDSDDAMVPNALEKLARLWDSIPESERHVFYAVGALCCDQNNRIVGDTFSTSPFDADLRELTYVFRILGEKWIVGLTEILRRYPFPEVAGTQFVPEGIVWYDIAKKFKIRWLNEALRIYYSDDSGTGVTLSKRTGLAENSSGRWHYYLWLLNNNLEYFFHSPTPFIKAAVALPVVAQYSGKSLKQTFMSLRKSSAKVLVGLGLPASILYYFLEKTRSVYRTNQR
jgi:glycosyltransferase involved in cell wall biosynthesis